VVFDPTQEATLLLIPTGAGETRALPRGSLVRYHWATFFPDGRKVLILGNESGRPMRLFAQDITHGLPRAFSAEEWQVPEPSNPVSPDGNWVAATHVGKAAAPLLVPVEGGEPRRIEGLGPGDIPLAWTRDGQSLFVRESGGHMLRRIVLFNLRTRSRNLWKELRPSEPSGARLVYEPVIARDGEVYFYTVYRGLANLVVADGLK
jgi:Tol biopolymer transport system component